MVCADDGEITEDIDEAGLGGGELVGFEPPGKKSGTTQASGGISLASEVTFKGDANQLRGFRLGGRERAFFVVIREKDFSAAIEHHELFGNEKKENEEIGFADVVESNHDIVPV